MMKSQRRVLTDDSMSPEVEAQVRREAKRQRMAAQIATSLVELHTMRLNLLDAGEAPPIRLMQRIATETSKVTRAATGRAGYTDMTTQEAIEQINLVRELLNEQEPA